MRTTNSNDQGITHKVFGPFVLFFLGGVLHLALDAYESASGSGEAVEPLTDSMLWIFSAWPHPGRHAGAPDPGRPPPVPAWVAFIVDVLMVMGTAVELVLHLLDGELPAVVLSFFTNRVPGAAAVVYG